MTFRLADASIGGVPLHSVSAIVVDTETTGLSPASDRVVQIGAVRIEKGRLGGGDIFDKLVNPGVSIPPATTKIHGICDADVTGAPAFQVAMREFAAWAGARLVIGYSIGFDLAILRAECARGGLRWHRPRSLDVRDLVEIVAPDLPQGSLDVAADWLGVTIDARHNALGDAQATAEIYLALLPKLAEKGIVTLAQAERACLRQVGTGREAGRSAGWEEVVEEARLVPASVNEYARIDSFPYRHRIRDIMNAPPRTIDASRSLGEALEIMMSERISSVFTTASGEAGADGILTERDILRAINDGKADALNRPVEQHASRPLATIDQDEFVYRAIVDMSMRAIRHLGVHDSSGAIVGALSARDLLKQRASDAISLGDSIASADTAEELGTIWSELTVVARGLIYEEVDARDIAAVISNELRALTRRACELAERELIDAGEGPPPVSYTMLVLGSGGRGESLLAMDQDNAIVYKDIDDADGSADAWLEKLGKRVADILDGVGVAYCQGGVMAQNAAWRMSESQWRQTVARWISRSEPEDILNADIFFDCRPVHGEVELGDSLRRDAIAARIAVTKFSTNPGDDGVTFRNTNWHVRALSPDERQGGPQKRWSLSDRFDRPRRGAAPRHRGALHSRPAGSHLWHSRGASRSGQCLDRSPQNPAACRIAPAAARSRPGGGTVQCRATERAQQARAAGTQMGARTNPRRVPNLLGTPLFATS